MRTKYRMVFNKLLYAAGAQLRYSIENQKLLSWENQNFDGDVFQCISIEGGSVDSNFSNCEFNQLDWYWGLFNEIDFLNCKFFNCRFRGSVFAACKFINCEFVGCEFTSDNLNSPCEFKDSSHRDCTFKNCKGFNAKHI